MLKLSLEDIKAALPLKSGAWKTNEDLKSAMKLLLSDVDSLEFWCTIAGWDWKTVRECAKRLSWGRDVKLVPKIGRPMMPDGMVKPGTLYWREWYKKRRAKNG